MVSPTAALFLSSLYFLQGWSASQAACGNWSRSAAALDLMLAEYERDAPPPAPPAHVQLALDVRHASVHEPSSTVRLLADLKMKWEDTRISWNASEIGCDWMLVDAERLWLPDVVVLNAVGEGCGAGWGELRARVSCDGGVSLVRRLDVSAPVSLDLRAWPADTQTAVFKIGSRAHDVDEIDININSDYKYLTLWESHSWETVSVWAGVTSPEEAGGVARRVAEWRVSLARRAAAARLAGGATLLASCLLLVAASLLPPRARPPLYACIAFISCLWLATALQRLPSSGTSPRALVVPGALGVLAALAAVLAALVVRVAHLRAPSPRPVRDIVDAATKHLKISLNNETSGASNGTWAACAQLLDYVVLAIVFITNLVLLAVYFF